MSPCLCRGAIIGTETETETETESASQPTRTSLAKQPSRWQHPATHRSVGNTRSIRRTYVSRSHSRDPRPFRRIVRHAMLGFVKHLMVRNQPKAGNHSEIEQNSVENGAKSRTLDSSNISWLKSRDVVAGAFHTLQNSSFLMWISSFLIQNSSLLIQNDDQNRWHLTKCVFTASLNWERRRRSTN